MPFKVTARTILELGAELIGSDGVALYELVKNSIDAGSTRILITMQVIITNSTYQEAINKIENGVDIATIQRYIISSMIPNTPIAQRDHFREQILTPTADPSFFRKILHDAYCSKNWIRVKDDGHGMNLQDLQNIYLTIGTRSRRQEKIDQHGHFTNTSRTILGDKGIGRLSVIRLGDLLLVETSCAGDQFCSQLKIDWERFSHESNELIEEIEIQPTQGKLKRNTEEHGTTITISNLRRDWDAASFKRIAEEHFKRIIDPFPTSTSKQGCPHVQDLFELTFNGRRHFVPTLPKQLLRESHAVVTAEYEILEDGSPQLRGEIDYKLRRRTTAIRKNEAELLSLADPIADGRIRTSPNVLRRLGSFSVRFYWYNRRLLKEVEGIGPRKATLAAVNSWAGGLMLFRDFFRINPYGEQEDDWLELDRTALGSSGYKVNRSQIIGQVSISSQNYRLGEQTNRKGLVENEYKQVLVGILKHLIATEFRGFINRVDKERKVSDETTTEIVTERIKETGSRITETIRFLQGAVPEQSPALNELRQLTVNLAKSVEDAREIVKEYKDDRSKFVYLAGIGLMVEFLLHEIGRATSAALDSLESIDKQKLEAAGSAALLSLESQLVTLGKRVEKFDPISTSRRQIKELVDVNELVQQVIDGRKQQFSRHSIGIGFFPARQAFRVKAVRGMLVQILENLFENSIYWLKVETRRHRAFEPAIDVVVDARDRTIVFSDNGTGVDLERAEQIFEPFVTSKPPGEGRGLGLYISREMAEYHDWKLSLAIDDSRVSGAERSSTFLLEIGETK